MTKPTLSIIISNYNYEQFVAQAIESALSLDWPSTQVIVIDDGSTDESRAVITGYLPKIEAVFTANFGQREAMNEGYRRARGDVIIFLDSDDVLPSEISPKIILQTTDGVSKTQVSMRRIDSAGVSSRDVFPHYAKRVSPSVLRAWAVDTTAYPTPPGSGNIYSRWFLDQVMPLPRSLGRAGDSGLLAAAPLLGDVLTEPGTYVKYRRHATNDSGLRGDGQRILRECFRALNRWQWACAVAGLMPSATQVLRSRELLQFRAAAGRLIPSIRLPGDSRSRVLRDSAACLWRRGNDSLVKRSLIGVWAAAVTLAPFVLSRWLIDMRFGRS